MIRLLADEDFNNDIVTGVKRRNPGVDLVCVRDTDVAGRPDREVIAWAASQGRVLLTHDVNTLIRTAADRVANGELMSGVAAAVQTTSVNVAIDEILLIAECSEPEEWDGQIRFLPL